MILDLLGTSRTGHIISAEHVRIRSRTVRLDDGQRRRIRMEACFWEGVDEILDREQYDLAELVALLEDATDSPSSAPLVSRLRRFVIHYFEQASRLPAPVRVRKASAKVISFNEFRRNRESQD